MELNIMKNLDYISFVNISTEITTRKSTTRSPSIGWARQNAVPLKFDPKQSEATFSATFSTSVKMPTRSNW